ncbi:broad-specificity cellobiase [Clostridium sp. USBA 49]|uniref:glycoside hydrolase family 1 protein n=1 Tax=Clostridium sp. USBA 49 TaxID=1881060 RepID=UPI00099A4EC2|nr:family 1 glycosylhydrolase [Clostridium sp. USBA 49]SKA85433.1 broad-specificity cellobiase [Clostridium sp. USBA 49]
MNKFSKDFLFGTGTSAYQIEGAPYEDGKTASIWDTYSSIPGNVFRNQSADIACDHYHRYKEDIQLLKNLGVDSYRFSISWPRVFPEKGKVNQKGIEFYKNLIDELLKNNIKPMITLYHWDLPQWAYDLGGWLNRDIVNWFEEYTSTMFKAFGNKVTLWVTHNEPFCVSMLGYLKGLHAPGHENFKEALITAHNILLSHGAAVKAFRKFHFKDSKIGITINLSPGYPLEQTQKNIELAKIADGFVDRWFMDPLFKGSYPEDMVQIYKTKVGELDFIKAGDFELIGEPMDFLGVNFYARNMVKPSKEGFLGYVGVTEKMPQTQKEWNLYPEILFNLLMSIKNEYTSLPIFITENGLALEGYKDNAGDDEKFGTIITSANNMDFVAEDGRVHDETRILYIYNCLRQCLKFIENGGNLKGYYLWSLMDNFEWALGYSKRFGITYVNFETQERIIKDSGYWYRKVIENRTLELKL